VTRFEWSPDGRRIAFTVPDPDPEAAKAAAEGYEDYEAGRRGAWVHLWVVGVPRVRGEFPRPERLTGGDRFSVGEFSWSPEGKRIAFSAARDPDPASQGTADIYVLDVARRSARKVVATRGPDVNPVWSPDGKHLAYQTCAGHESFFWRNHYVAVVPADGGTPRVLTGAFDERAYLLAWGPAGIYFWALQKTDVHLFHLDPRTRAVRRVSKPRHGVFWQFSFDRGCRRVAFLAASARDYGEVCVSGVERFAPRRLTALGGR
jgi:Tol biopolymer transport system component